MLVVAVAAIAAGIARGAGAAVACGAGAVAAGVIQMLAARALMRASAASTVSFLGAFGRVSLMRIGGGSAAIALAFAAKIAGAPWLLAGFAVQYVVLEVATDLRLLRVETGWNGVEHARANRT